MEININSRITWSSALAPVQAARAAPEPVRDNAAFNEVAKLKQALAATPDIRTAVVARAKSLLEDVNYPPMETIQKIGQLLAVHFSDSTESLNLTES
jgi:hypothetical protein